MTRTGAAPDRDRLAQLLKEAGSALDPDGVDRAGRRHAGGAAGNRHVLARAGRRPDPAGAGRGTGRTARLSRRGLPRRSRTGGFRPAAARRPGSRCCARNWRTRRLDGFIVPRADEHQGEYVPACGQRLAWLTGFTGSAGMAIVLTDRAALFVDGRYTLQAAAQVDPALFEIRHLIEEPPAQWLAGALGKGAVARLRPVAAHAAGGRAAAGRRRARRREPAGGRRQPGRPGLAGPAGGAARAGGAASRPLSPARALPPSAPGSARALAEDGVAAAVLTMPELIAWLLNIRGGDVPHTPLPLSFAILRDDGSVRLFIDRRKLAPGLDRHLGNEVAIEPPGRLGPALDALAVKSRAGSGCRSTRQPPRPGCSTGSRQAGGRHPSRRRPVPAAESLQEPGRDSTAPAPRIAATAPR